MFKKFKHKFSDFLFNLSIALDDDKISSQEKKLINSIITKSTPVINNIEDEYINDDSNLTDDDKRKFQQNAIEYNDETKKILKTWYENDNFDKFSYKIKTVRNIITNSVTFIKEIINFDKTNGKIKPADKTERIKLRIEKLLK